MQAAPLTAALSAPTLWLGVAAAAYALSTNLGRVAAAASALAIVFLRLSPSEPAFPAWATLVVLVVIIAAAERSAWSSSRRHAELVAADEARRFQDRQLADEARLSRSLAAIASGLQGAFEPARRLHRFTSLVRTLLSADAAVTMIAEDGQRQFQILSTGQDGEPSTTNGRDTVFPLDGIDSVGVQSLSFSAGESGLLGALMRERLSSHVGFAAAILHGKQLAGLLLVGYRDPTRELSETDRSLLAGAAALCATLFESARLHQELRASNQVKTEFISTVSHELRTPLNAIIGYCDLLRDGTMGEINADQCDALDRLKRHSVELAELIEAILEVDRLEGSYLAIDWTECDLDGFFRQLQASIPAYWQKEGVELRWVETASARTILTDPEKLRLSLRNLVHNALKFTAAGSVTVEMSVTPGTLMFTVRDTGVGIAPEVKESLFQMFQMGGRGNARTKGGLGLGLYLADRMVRALWGQISIESSLGEGTTARIILPIEEPITTELSESATTSA